MRRTLIIGTGLLLVIGLCLNASTDIGRNDGLPDRAFDAKAWREGDRRVRGAMVADLEKRQLLIGASKQAVIKLLGAPDASDTLGPRLEYDVDLGLRTGPWGLGGTWLFNTTVRFDTLSGTACEVRTHD
ncbi:MAG: hypothetical protein IT229_13775 [Flavobacteriales bacterium]|nr:hypothetical protein [Flavobacteriales bacterium]